MMDINKSTILVFVLNVLFGCGPDKSNDAHRDLDKTIILVNYKTVDRETIARGLQIINRCDPKLIGINALFIEPKGAIGDSLLAQAIRANKNVVLAFNGNFDRIHTTQDSIKRSNVVFSKNCLAEGLVHYGFTNNLVSSHLPYRSVGDSVVWSFPVTIASYYNMDLGTKFMHDFVGNKYYKILFRKNLNEFKVLDIDKLGQVKCNELKDKIILFGYLGPTEDDLISTDSEGSEKMYSTVVLANIILNLLDQEPVRLENETREEKLPPTQDISHLSFLFYF